MLVISFTMSTAIVLLFFFFNDTATTEIYTLSLHDALPISSGDDDVACGRRPPGGRGDVRVACRGRVPGPTGAGVDRKSIRLNSSHSQISYAVFCLKKKKKKKTTTHQMNCDDKILHYVLTLR